MTLSRRSARSCHRMERHHGRTPRSPGAHAVQRHATLAAGAHLCKGRGAVPTVHRREPDEMRDEALCWCQCLRDSKFATANNREQQLTKFRGSAGRPMPVSLTFSIAVATTCWPLSLLEPSRIVRLGTDVCALQWLSFVSRPAAPGGDHLGVAAATRSCRRRRLPIVVTACW